jgi:hypothetical protein
MASDQQSKRRSMHSGVDAESVGTGQWGKLLGVILIHR